MEAIAEVVAETGVLTGKRRRAVDSTVRDDAVARQDTITQLIAGIRRFGRDIPDGQELLATHAAGYDYTRTGRPDIDWDDQAARGGLVSALVTDEHRQRAADPAFQDDYRTHRPMVERSIAWLHLRIAGLNLRRLINLGLTVNEGSWALR